MGRKVNNTQKTLARDDWCTPQKVLTCTRKIAPIIYDPCGNPWSQVDAQFVMMLPKYQGVEIFGRPGVQMQFGDGLTMPFPRLDPTSLPPGTDLDEVMLPLTYINPPYGKKDNPLWAQYTAEMANFVGDYGHIVSLVPASTSAAWWDYYWQAAAVCFLRGRVRFVGAKTGAPFESAVVYFGPRPDLFRTAFQTIGRVVTDFSYVPENDNDDGDDTGEGAA